MPLTVHQDIDLRNKCPSNNSVGKPTIKKDREAVSVTPGSVMQLPDYKWRETWGRCRRSNVAVLLLVLVVLCLARATVSQKLDVEGADQNLPARHRLSDVVHVQRRRYQYEAAHVQDVGQPQQPEPGDQRRPRSYRKKPTPPLGQTFPPRRRSCLRRKRPSLHGPDVTGVGRFDGAHSGDGFKAGKQERCLRRRRPYRHRSSRRQTGQLVTSQSDALSRGPRQFDEMGQLKMCKMTSPFGSPRCQRIRSMARPCRPTRNGRQSGPFSATMKGSAGNRKCRGKRFLQSPQHDLLYADWTGWGSCTRACKQRRIRMCKKNEVCQLNFFLETRRCGAPGTRCHERVKSGARPAAKPTSDVVQHGKAKSDLGSGQGRTPTETTTVTTTTTQDGGASSGSEVKADKSTRPPRKTKDQEEQSDKGLTGKGDNSQKQEGGQDELLALRDTCGIRPPATRGSYRVVGGQEAQPLSWPWQVAILTRWEEQYCAGTLIAPQWVLTAAHCVRKKSRRRRIVVRAGEHNLGEYEGTEDDVKPSKEFPYPDFDYATITNDIALVHLNRPLRTRTKAVTGFACLPDADFEPDHDSLCYVLGWGKRRNTHLFGAEALHEAKVPRVSHRRCQQAFEYEINNMTQVCAGYKQGGRDACAGDSGGPLLCPRTDHAGVTRWFLVGVTSYGEGCGRKGKFGIYTNVVSYRQWLADTIRSN